MEKSEKQRLLIDLDLLFPGESLTIGKNSLIIRPLCVEQISMLSKKIKGIVDIFSKEGITWENYSEKNSLFTITVILLDTFPEVLEEASNIDINDLKKLPLNSIVEIVTKVIEVNLKSKDDLVKNFKSLTEKLSQQIQVEEVKEKKTKAKIKA